MIIHTRSFPRAALIGNPSDGYNGKTIAFVFDNFKAEVFLYETPELEILPQERDRSIYKNLDGLYRDVQLHGYYGGIRLLKATIKKFQDHCTNNRIVLDSRNFTIRYKSDIPHQVGLAGSSAIITACMRALMQFYNIKIPKPLLANLILSVETEELGIGAGLQDRVAQVYEQPVYMDFSKSLMDERNYGEYLTFNPDQLSNLFVAYRTDLSQGSEVVHNDLMKRYKDGDNSVVNAMQQFALLTVEAKKCLESGNSEKLSQLMDANFNLRESICVISEKNKHMVKLARSAGVSAKFTGSGGAIIGIFPNEDVFQKLYEKLQKHQISVIKPNIVYKS